MKISNVIAYHLIGADQLPSLEAIELGLLAQKYQPCGPSQESSAGFVPPRDENGAMVEAIDGQWLGRMRLEARSVPGSEVRRAVDARAADIEKTTGRKPGRKEKKDIKEDVTLELLPRAFSKITHVGFWIDRESETLVIDTASQTRADAVATALVKAIDGLTLALINTTKMPDVSMASWLMTAEAPAGFTIDRDCELKAFNESRAIVKYTNHPLDTDDVREHIEKGMRPSWLAMTWDDRVSFVLTAAGTIRGLVMLEGTGDGEAGKAADNFDANAVIATGETRALMAALLEALGGHAQFGLGETADQQDTPADADPMYEQALALVREKGNPSISLVQRHLKMGYNRAASLIEQMEKAGAVSAADSSGVRKVVAG